MSLPHSFLSGKGGGGSSVVGISALLSGGVTLTTGGIEFYHGNHSATDRGDNRLIFSTNPGGQFYVGLIGAGSGGGYNKKGSMGGAGIALVTVPPGVTTMYLFMGGRGSGTTDTAGTPSRTGGLLYGGAAGIGGNSTYDTNAASSGGGMVGLFTSDDAITQGNAVVMVGSAGAGGSGSGSVNDYQAGGGSINGDGLPQNPGNAGGGISSAYGATTSAGGLKGQANYGHGSNNHQDGWALTGGRGSDSQYDAGSGGGAGYFGGGGGSVGGGYDGGSGGGGSGYIDPVYASIVGTGTTYNRDGTWIATQGLYPFIYMNTWVRLVSGATAYSAPSGDFGGTHTGADRQNGNAGFGVVWNAPI